MALSWKKTSVIHTGIEDDVLDQLKLREEILGKKVKTIKSLTYLEGRTGWVKVSSGVDTASSGSSDYSSALASSTILSGGTLNEQQKLRGGILGSKTDAYRLGALGEGYRPMAGLTNFQSEVLGTYGTYQRVSFNVTANSLDQLNELEQLYLRPGMSILIEWGHTIHAKRDSDNNNTVISTNIKTVTDFFESFKTEEEQETAKDRIYDEIKSIKEESNYNYDALFARITNFSWEFNEDGTYECQVQAMGHGALIESVRLLTYPSTGETTAADTTKLNSDITKFNTFLSNIEGAGFTNGMATILDRLKKAVPDLLEEFQRNIKQTGKNFSVVAIRNNSEAKEPLISYIRLSNILELINIVFAIRDDVKKDGYITSLYTGGNKDIITPYLTFSGHFSGNPSVCILPKQETSKVFSYDFVDDVSDLAGDDSDILDIFVSVRYVLDTFNDVIDQNAKDQSIFDFVDRLMFGIGESLGNINQFGLHEPDQRGVHYIVDRKVTPHRRDIEKSVLNLRGTKTTAHNVKIQSRLTSDMMTTMAIGATASETDIAEDVLNVQSWNAGLKDRFFPDPGFSGGDSKSSTSSKLAKQQGFERLKSYVDGVNKDTKRKTNGFLYGINNSRFTISYNPDAAKDIQPVYRRVMVELYKYATSNSNTNAAGLIPINISFSIDGISGLKIAQAFTISEGLLPAKYNDKVGFIIKGLSHTIGADNRWITDVDGIMSILDNETPPVEEINLDEFIKKTIKELPIAEEVPETLLYAPVFTNDSLASLETRNDSEGQGSFGTERDGGSRTHAGWDIKVSRNKPVYAPITGTYEFSPDPREYPFTEKGGSRVTITGTGIYKGWQVKVAYVVPKSGAGLGTSIEQGATVNKGTIIAGVADMVNGHFKRTPDGTIIKDENGNGEMFPGYGSPMINHVHVEAIYNSGYVALDKWEKWDSHKGTKVKINS